MAVEPERLQKLARLVRYYILRMTTRAGSGHATSSLSATDLMVALFFGKFRFDLDHPNDPDNDRVIFSKGHASPLLYALYAACGVISEKELDSYRQFESKLEGHPTPRFKYVDAATGSLGQGLSIGLGMALAMRAGAEVGLSARAFSNASVLRPPAGGLGYARPSGSSSENAAREQTSPRLKARGTRDILDTLPRVYVLMGDSEVSEGSVWEAIELASYYHIGNLIGIIDVNRLGQSGETMLGWDTDTYKRRVEAFGWQAYVIDGHDFGKIRQAFDKASQAADSPQMIIAKTVKGRGVSFLEDKEGWHGKALSDEQYQQALKELGEIDRMIRGEVAKPSSQSTVHSSQFKNPVKKLKVDYKLGEEIATRKAYGETLAALGAVDERIVVLDGEVSNSTFSEIFRDKFPKRYFEMFIAEQNMAGVALGMSKRGYVPFVSTFAAFLTRAFDQIRMSAISSANIKFVGSHAGVSIGEDGPSQMGLEDIAMFRAVFGSIVLCPADAVSCAKLIEQAAGYEGLVYIRTARPSTPVIYSNKEEFKIGGSKIIRESKSDKLTIVACGVVIIEAIKAAQELEAEGINVRVIDAYSIKPIDEKTIRKAAFETKNLVITVEDHWFDGGLGDAVLNVFAQEAKVKVYKLAVWQMPMSGKPGELLDWQEISARAIVKKVLEIAG